MASFLAPDAQDMWKHRRRLAYLAMLGLFMSAYTAVFKDIQQPQSDVLVAAVYSFAAIVGAYTGLAVMDTVSKRKAETEIAVAGKPKIEPIGDAHPE